MKLTRTPLSRSWLALVAGALIPTALTIAPVERPQASDDLNAVLWVQRSAEYRALCEQTFATATRALDLALADESRTAAIEQIGSEFEQLPPAIIVDVDETMLDNSPYNARLIEDDSSYELESWTAWVEERKAEPIPGALEFVRRATTLGITVFYVTNRDKGLEVATRDNLERCGFPVSLDQLLMREEIDQDGIEKRNRRAHIAKSHHILMLAGDDLGDFLPGSRSASAVERESSRQLYSTLFGERWFVLPNPIYGSWTKSLGDDKRAALRADR
ncbi:MAG: HAD family acid phosphatase [Planctomycetota bacterium]